MATVTSFHGSEIGRDQLRAVLADALQLEQLHAVRQWQLRLYGLLTGGALALTFGRVPAAMLIAIALAGLAVPGWSWWKEMRCQRRIEHRLEPQKVVKSP